MRANSSRLGQSDCRRHRGRPSFFWHAPHRPELLVHQAGHSWNRERTAARNRSPSCGCRESRERHDLDGSDAEVSQIVQPINRAAKCAFLCKGPDVQFIYDAFFPTPSGPCAVAPLVAMRVDNLTRPVHIIGLKARSWVRNLQPILKPILVPGSHLRRRNHQFVPTIIRPGHRHRITIVQDNRDVVLIRAHKQKCTPRFASWAPNVFWGKYSSMGDDFGYSFAKLTSGHAVPDSNCAPIARMVTVKLARVLALRDRKSRLTRCLPSLKTSDTRYVPW